MAISENQASKSFGKKAMGIRPRRRSGGSSLETRPPADAALRPHGVGWSAE